MLFDLCCIIETRIESFFLVGADQQAHQRGVVRFLRLHGHGVLTLYFRLTLCSAHSTHASPSIMMS